ncbi:MAG: hypothetical protein HY711_04615, partial [Candidatus Melainabacteria bacterium]|nr:hypothetical protein [Candidatus Melainabacteria bacterium]
PPPAPPTVAVTTPPSPMPPDEPPPQPACNPSELIRVTSYGGFIGSTRAYAGSDANKVEELRRGWERVEGVTALSPLLGTGMLTLRVGRVTYMTPVMPPEVVQRIRSMFQQFLNNLNSAADRLRANPCARVEIYHG